jgi:lipopolysaccharide/colanic/teichoic acid biosynthesis glycosyltransferase
MSAAKPYRGKRAIDLVLLSALALPALLIGGLCALAVRVLSGRPVLFRQQRVGWNGREFAVIKFRTMIDAPDNPLFPDDERITSVGRVLRRLSLDELPQLINVARGEMSIVGPRPTLSYQVERYDEAQRRRLDVRPGLTGLAQLRGRNAIGWSERIEHDLEYVARQSPWLDAALVARTFGAMLHGKGHEGHPEDDPIARLADPDPTGEGDER